MNPRNSNKITFDDLRNPVKIALGIDWIVSKRTTITIPNPMDRKEHWHLIVELFQDGIVKDVGECIFEIDYDFDLPAINQAKVALGQIRRASDGSFIEVLQK
jgi:hypothetical protein